MNSKKQPTLTVFTPAYNRAYTLNLDNYTPNELRAYIQEKDNAFTDDEVDRICCICSCPGDVNLLVQQENAELIDLVDKLVINIDKVTLSNLLKLSKKFKINDNSEGMDINLFLNCLQYVLYKKYLQTRKDKYYYGYREVIFAKGALRQNTTNKLYTLDLLLTEMWKLWNCGN